MEAEELSTNGRVEAIFTSPAAGLAAVRRTRVRASPGIGLDGDRYATGRGHWSGDRKVSRDLTLIEAEVVEDVCLQLGLPLEVSAFRRNIVTRDVRLNDFLGVRFFVGSVLVRGTRLCEPCEYLARLTGRDIVVPLVHCGGLRVDILTAGTIAEGDGIRGA